MRCLSSCYLFWKFTNQIIVYVYQKGIFHKRKCITMFGPSSIENEISHTSTMAYSYLKPNHGYIAKIKKENSQIREVDKKKINTCQQNVIDHTDCWRERIALAYVTWWYDYWKKPKFDIIKGEYFSSRTGVLNILVPLPSAANKSYYMASVHQSSASSTPSANITQYCWLQAGTVGV